MRGGAVPIQAKALCVVWHAKNAAAPAALRAALERPGFRSVDCDNPFAAIAQLGRARANGQRTSLVLVLVEPDALSREIAPLLEVAERFAPGLVLWAYNAGQSPSIRQVSPSDFVAPPPVVVRPQHRAAQLRLAGEDFPASPPESGATSAAQSDPAPRAMHAAPPAGVPRSRFMELTLSENATSENAPSGSTTSENVTPEPGDDSGVSYGSAGGRAGGKPLLSDEELAMLLADDAEDTRA